LKDLAGRLAPVGVGAENAGSDCAVRFRVIWEDK